MGLSLVGNDDPDQREGHSRLSLPGQVKKAGLPQLLKVKSEMGQRLDHLAVD